jgi:hypothetical protein
METSASFEARSAPSSYPTAALLRRPVPLELLGDQSPQSGDCRELTPLRAPGQLPGGGIGGRRAGAGAAAVPPELAAHRGRGASEPPGDLAHAVPDRHAARDLLALRQRQRSLRRRGSGVKPPVPGQDALHHRAPAIEGAGDRAQRFALAPSTPELVLVRRAQVPPPFPSPHPSLRARVRVHDVATTG